MDGNPLTLLRDYIMAFEYVHQSHSVSEYGREVITDMLNQHINGIVTVHPELKRKLYGMFKECVKKVEEDLKNA